MSDDLVKRLREVLTASQFLRLSDLYEHMDKERQEAADRIEQLERENAALKAEVRTLRNAAVLADERAEKAEAENAALRESAELAAGILWMVNYRDGKVKAAFHALRDTIGHNGLKAGITKAIAAGHEAYHPPGTDWWAGKKEETP